MIEQTTTNRKQVATVADVREDLRKRMGGDKCNWSFFRRNNDINRMKKVKINDCHGKFFLRRVINL